MNEERPRRERTQDLSPELRDVLVKRLGAALAAAWQQDHDSEKTESREEQDADEGRHA